MIYEKLAIVFLSTIASEKKDSTNSHIATYILDHLQAVQHMGIVELAKECHVAMSSISRFCKDIGLRDFVELKELLISTNLHFEQASLSLSSNQRMHDYHEKIQKNIETIVQSIDMNKIHALCQDLDTYQNISIFGLLKAGFVAMNLQADLLMLGKHVYTNISYHQQIQHITKAHKEDLIIIFSYTGSYFDYQHLRNVRSKMNPPKIWFISSNKHPKCPFNYDIISFDSLQDQISHPYQLQFIAGLIAQEYGLRHNQIQ